MCLGNFSENHKTSKQFSSATTNLYPIVEEKSFVVPIDTTLFDPSTDNKGRAVVLVAILHEFISDGIVEVADF